MAAPCPFAPSSFLDETGSNPKVTCEPNSTGGLSEAPRTGKDYTPQVSAPVGRFQISPTNDYKQAGERYRAIEEWERDELISHLVANLSQCEKQIQQRMVWRFTQCDLEYGSRVAQGLGLSVDMQAPERGSREFFSRRSS